MAVKFRISGLREIDKALAQLPKATAKNVVRRILRERGKPMAEAAKRKAPVDDGELRDSIGVSTKLSKRQRRRHRKEDRDDIEMFVGAGMPHAHLQEFGTVNHGPNPFLRPAWNSHKNGILDGIKDDLWKEIHKAAERQRKKAAKKK